MFYSMAQSMEDGQLRQQWKSSRPSSTSAYGEFYAWGWRTKSAIPTCGKEPGKILWKMISEEEDGNGLATPSESPPPLQYHQASPDLEPTREAEERTPTEHLAAGPRGGRKRNRTDMETTGENRSEPGAMESSCRWCKLLEKRRAKVSK